MKNVCFLALSFLSFSLFSQDLKEDRLGSWLIIFGNTKIAEPLNVTTEFRWQNYQFYNDLDNVFGRIGLDYKVTPRLFVHAGYVHQYSKTLSNINVSENRMYEEATLKNKIKTMGIAHRYRIEHRWINKMGNTELSHRFRYRLQLTHPLSDVFYCKFFDEIFFNLKEPSFNQNRLHFGVGYSLNPNFQLELGYLKVHFSSTHYDIFRIGVNFKADLRKQRMAP